MNIINSQSLKRYFAALLCVTCLDAQAAAQRIASLPHSEHYLLTNQTCAAHSQFEQAAPGGDTCPDARLGGGVWEKLAWLTEQAMAGAMRFYMVRGRHGMTAADCPSIAMLGKLKRGVYHPVDADILAWQSGLADAECFDEYERERELRRSTEGMTLLYVGANFAVMGMCYAYVVLGTCMRERDYQFRVAHQQARLAGLPPPVDPVRFLLQLPHVMYGQVVQFPRVFANLIGAAPDGARVLGAWLGFEQGLDFQLNEP